MLFLMKMPEEFEIVLSWNLRPTKNFAFIVERSAKIIYMTFEHLVK